jgi:hypothetical protein
MDKRISEKSTTQRGEFSNFRIGREFISGSPQVGGQKLEEGKALSLLVEIQIKC